MQTPLEISWHHVDKSEALESEIRSYMEKMEEFHPDIIGARVSVEKPHGRHQQGNLYNIKVVITVPDQAIVVQRNPGDNHAHEDVYVSLRDTFDAVRRKLEEHARKRRGQTKLHDSDSMHRATVLRKFPLEGYGFLVTPDAREIYFHENAVTGSPFEQLEEGAEVSFVEEMGEQGPQAKKVLTGKHDISL